MEAAQSICACATPDDNGQVEVVGRVGRVRGVERCGIDIRGRHHAARVMAEPVERASASDRCRRSARRFSLLIHVCNRWKWNRPCADIKHVIFEVRRTFHCVYLSRSLHLDRHITTSRSRSLGESLRDSACERRRAPRLWTPTCALAQPSPNHNHSLKLATRPNSL